MNSDGFFVLLSLLIALVAVFFGPLIQLRIAKRQIRATVVSANRQAWINTLRDTIAEFISLTRSITAKSPELKGYRDEAFVKDINESIFLQSKIALLLNPLEDDHNQLLDLVTKAAYSAKNSREERAYMFMDRMCNDIIALSKSILKKEWERVKRGE